MRLSDVCRVIVSVDEYNGAKTTTLRYRIGAASGLVAVRRLDITNSHYMSIEWRVTS